MSRSSEDATGVRTIVAPGTIDESQITERPAPAVPIAGRYKVTRRLGKGGMGEVMLARDEQVGRDVAIKRMRASSPNDRQVTRFLREASIQGRLEHPAIVPVHEIGKDNDGLPFFAMKRLAGTTLADILADKDNGRDSQSKLAPRSRFTLQQILRAFVEVCLAMEFAHVRGVVHRDLKPDNIMLGDFGEVYVLDWGVAKIAGEHDDDFTDVDSSGGSGEHATQAGTTIGTPGYMAPEQVRGSTGIDGRTDVYTLGCLLFEILAGEPMHPRGYEGLQSALFRSGEKPSTRAPNRDIPPELDLLCAQATQPERELRLATARELGDGVQRFLDGDRDHATRRTLAKQHLERARDAFSASIASDDSAHRSMAMREAAGALALDPAQPGAAELMGRLMLEPPKTVPREVQAAILEDNIRAARINAKGGFLAVIGGLILIPILWSMSPAGSLWVPALGLTIIVMGVISLYNIKAKQPLTGLVVIGNMVMIGFISGGYSPLLAAPGLAAVLTMAMVFTPRFSWLSSGVTVAASAVIGVFLPLLLEVIGVLPATQSFEGRGVRFEVPAVASSSTPEMITYSCYCFAVIIGAAWVAEVMRTRNRDSHRALMLQAWQLQQLVPR
ncbi:MAG: protein kinase [Myxococcales bacterium]